jgi:hypothetical protein
MGRRNTKWKGDLTKLVRNDPFQVVNWAGDCMDDLRFKSMVFRMIREWIEGMDKDTFEKTEKILKKGVRDFVPPETPDNVIQFRKQG